jgi:hypothetical protein
MLLAVTVGLGCGATGNVPAADQAPAPANKPAAANEPREAKLLATLKHRSGNEFLFFAGDFQVKIIEKGTYANGTVPIALDMPDPTVLDVYRYLAPDQPIPAALVAASERFEDWKRNKRPRPPAPASSRGDVEMVQQAGRLVVNSRAAAPTGDGDDRLCPERWFRDTFCRIPESSLDVCWTRRSGNGSFSDSDIHAYHVAACSFSGQIVATLTFDDCRFPCITWTDHRVQVIVNEGEFARLIVIPNNQGNDFDAGFAVAGQFSSFHMAGIIED